LLEYRIVVVSPPHGHSASALESQDQKVDEGLAVQVLLIGVIPEVQVEVLQHRHCQSHVKNWVLRHRNILHVERYLSAAEVDPLDGRLEVNIWYPELFIVHRPILAGHMHFAHLSLDPLDHDLRCLILEFDCDKDGVVEDFVELSPELVEFLHFKENPGADQVAPEDHRIYLSLQEGLHILKLLIGVVRTSPQDPENVLEKLVKKG